MAKTSSGLEENVAGLLCYVLGWVSGVIFLILEPENKLIRFHAMQSIIVFGAFNVVWIIFFWIPIVGWVISGLVGLIVFILWIVLMYKAYQGEKYKLPIAGDQAEKWAEGGTNQQ
jgi:uncharacterized membrane protein